jgi:hypothetical protein
MVLDQLKIYFKNNIYYYFSSYREYIEHNWEDKLTLRLASLYLFLSLSFLLSPKKNKTSNKLK